MYVCMCIVEYGSLKPENFAGARDMDTAIFDVRPSHVNPYIAVYFLYHLFYGRFVDCLGIVWLCGFVRFCRLENAREERVSECPSAPRLALIRWKKVQWFNRPL